MALDNKSTKLNDRNLGPWLAAPFQSPVICTYLGNEYNHECNRSTEYNDAACEYVEDGWVVSDDETHW